MKRLYFKPTEQGKLTSINPLMTHGNEFRGDIKVLNRARQVKTCIWGFREVSFSWKLLHCLNNMNLNHYAQGTVGTVAASSWCPINVKSPNVNREKRVGVVAQKNTHQASKYFRF